jgi:hypothetical protein
MQEYGLRLEDYGNQVMSTLSRLPRERVVSGILEYLQRTPKSKYFMILSNKVGYYTVFRVESNSLEERAKKIYEFFEVSRYYNIAGEENPYVEMTDIKHYELNGDHKHLELWIGKEYFQLFPFDWGVEII